MFVMERSTYMGQFEGSLSSNIFSQVVFIPRGLGCVRVECERQVYSMIQMAVDVKSDCTWWQKTERAMTAMTRAERPVFGA